MRNIPVTLKKKLASRIQAGDNEIKSSFWVARPTTPLTEDKFLEKQAILSSGNVTKTSIAVCHPRLMRGATEIYVGYLEAGVIKVARTSYVEEMHRHIWEPDIGFRQEADDFCLCFNGTMPKAPSGYVEFITEEFPWVFWTQGGKLYAREMWSEREPDVLAESNCSTMSAIRAMWSESGGFDFGLVVFFLLNGQLYYRQRINGQWADGEVVNFGPEGAIWESIAAFRTWDYRIGVQCKTTTGEYYEMFTQFMGVGKQNVEHIEIKDVSIRSKFTRVYYSNTQLNEHINLRSLESTAPYGGLYSISVPSLIAARNIEDGNGDWGTIVVASFDVHLVAAQVASNNVQFKLVDSRGAAYTPRFATLGKNGKDVTLVFLDFNSAQGECEIRYIPGDVYSMATIKLEATSVKFTPQNLNPPGLPLPQVVKAWNE